MHLRNTVIGVVTGFGVALAGTPPVTINWAPHAQHELATRYGSDQEQVLRGALLESLEPQLSKVSLPAAASVLVTVERVAPTHPTPRQSADNPSLDPFASKSIGGAQLRGTVRDSDGRTLTAVSYSYYPSTLRLGSASKDAWADARLAFQGFAARLAAAARKLPAGH